MKPIGRSTNFETWRLTSLQMCHWRAKLQLVVPAASQPSSHRYGHDACASNLIEILEKPCPSDLFRLHICMVCFLQNCVHPREVVFCLFLLVACLHPVFHRECYLREYPCIAYYIVVRQAQHGSSASNDPQPPQQQHGRPHV